MLLIHIYQNQHKHVFVHVAPTNNLCSVLARYTKQYNSAHCSIGCEETSLCLFISVCPVPPSSVWSRSGVCKSDGSHCCVPLFIYACPVEPPLFVLRAWDGIICAVASIVSVAAAACACIIIVQE